MMNKFLKALALFGTFGATYGFIEILWRGYTHWSMIILGGLMGIVIGMLNEKFTFDMSLATQGIIGSCVVTLFEFITGLIVNIMIGLNVWDYSDMPFNIMGQVCLLYSILWIFVSIFAVILDDYLRYKWFDEEKPHYTLF